MSEKYTTVVQELMDRVLSAGDLPRLSDLLTEDCVVHVAAAQAPLEGVEEYRRLAGADSGVRD